MTTRDNPGKAVVLGLVLVGASGLLVVGVATGSAAGASTDGAGTAFVVELEEDGDATVALRLTFDLEGETDRRALDRIRANRTAITARFEDRLGAVVDRAAARTDRPMRISGADLTVDADDGTGRVEIAVQWTALAAVEGERLVVAAPFGAGFDPPGRFVIEPPAGYTLDDASPSPTASSEAGVSWGPDAALDGFEAAFVPAESGSTDAPGLPGFGVPAAITAVALAVAGAALLGRRRA